MDSAYQRALPATLRCAHCGGRVFYAGRTVLGGDDWECLACARDPRGTQVGSPRIRDQRLGDYARVMRREEEAG